MDTITQVTLGAAVGEVMLGKKIGGKAALWGGALGVVPDLDVLANPFLNEVQQIIAHRGITHSLLFCLVVPPLLGWLFSKTNSGRNVSWQNWSWMVFWVFATHIFIDVCTSYGTQVFQPFSNYAVSLNSIFIVDPFYTLPLMGGIVASQFFHKDSSRRRWLNYAGVVLSSLYLLMGLGVKGHVNSVFEANFQQQGISVDRYMTTPAPLSAFLWVGYAESNSQIYAGLYSVFDSDTEIRFHRTPKDKQLIERYMNDLPVQRVLWFSNGYYTVNRQEDGLYFSDLRFGRSDLWLSGGSAPYIWNYKLLFNADSTKVTGVTHFEPSFGTRYNQFGRLVDRIMGE